MNVFYIKCVSGNETDPDIIWKKDEWAGNERNFGTGTDKLENAQLFVDLENAKWRKEKLEKFGCEFKIVSFALVEDQNEEVE